MPNNLDNTAGWLPLLNDDDGDTFDGNSFARAILKELDMLQDGVKQAALRAYRTPRERLFHRNDDFTVAKLQQVFDALGPNGLVLMQRSQAAEEWIDARWPGALSEQEKGAQIPFTVAENGRLVFDPDAPYPGPLQTEQGGT